ncbi:uncharacterized protein BXZ73DRAFT_104618 [Epithele typhae]|uniref:uncharacterized protein n=1 Tax=Epithele typhae TaxID=378194 RepID=UPI0020078CA0|nr:uncharacterized protein BXZ73DRAFT_104618 [Epithele typhae]KAH9920888.1 hypothetical protein BXZ73DRAFT_104618 [Epithele typhae]
MSKLLLLGPALATPARPAPPPPTFKLFLQSKFPVTPHPNTQVTLTQQALDSALLLVFFVLFITPSTRQLLSSSALVLALSTSDVLRHLLTVCMFLLMAICGLLVFLCNPYPDLLHALDKFLILVDLVHEVYVYWIRHELPSDIESQCTPAGIQHQQSPLLCGQHYHEYSLLDEERPTVNLPGALSHHRLLSSPSSMAADKQRRRSLFTVDLPPLDGMSSESLLLKSSPIDTHTASTDASLFSSVSSGASNNTHDLTGTPARSNTGRTTTALRDVNTLFKTIFTRDEDVRWDYA